MGDATQISLTIVSNTKSAEEGMARVGASAEASLGKVGKASAEAETHLGKVGAAAETSGKQANAAAGGVKTMAEGFAAFEVVGDLSKEYAANESALNGLNQAMFDAGQKAGPQFTDALANTQEKARGLGFETSETTASVGQLVQAGVSWQAAMGAQDQIMDLARAKHISLADATQAVTMGMQGSGKALKALNIEMPPHLATTAQLDAANQKVAATLQKVQHDQDAYTAAVKAHGPHSSQATAAAYTLQQAHAALSAEQQKAADIQKSLGDRTGNLGALLGTLDEKVGGQAQAHTHDIGVQWDILKASFNEIGGKVIHDVLIPVLNQLMTALGFLADHANIVVPAIMAAVGALIAFKIAAAVGPVLEALSVGIKAVSTAFTFLAANPIVAAIIAVVAIIAVLQAKFDIFGKAAHALGPIMQAAGNIIHNVWTSVSTWVKQAFDIIIAVVKPIAAIVSAPFLLIAAIAIGVITGIVNLVKWAVSTFSPILAPVVGFFGAVFGGVATVIEGVFKVVSGLFSAYIGVWVAIVKTIAGPIQTVANIIGNIFKVALDGIGTAFNGAKTVIGAIWDGIATVMKAPVNGLITGLDGLIGLINGIQIHVHGPDWLGSPGFDWDGMKLPQIPHLAEGGIISARPGGTLVLAGEGGRDEAVVPLPDGWKNGGKPQRHIRDVNVNVQTNADHNRIASEVVWKLRTRGAF